MGSEHYTSYYIVLSEIGGAGEHNREFDFDFDSIVRAGEAKLCGCASRELSCRWGSEWRELLILLLQIIHTYKLYFVLDS